MDSILSFNCIVCVGLVLGLGRISGLAGAIFNIRPDTGYSKYPDTSYLADFYSGYPVTCRVSGNLPDIELWPDIRPEPDIKH